MSFIGVEVEQEMSGPPPKKNLDPPMTSQLGISTLQLKKHVFHLT